MAEAGVGPGPLGEDGADHGDRNRDPRSAEDEGERRGQLETARAFAATVLLFALAIALYGACALLERRVVDWLPRPGER